MTSPISRRQAEWMREGYFQALIETHQQVSDYDTARKLAEQAIPIPTVRRLRELVEQESTPESPGYNIRWRYSPTIGQLQLVDSHGGFWTEVTQYPITYERVQIWAQLMTEPYETVEVQD